MWALGLLAFWMLTGKYYWRAAQQRDVGQAEALLHEKLYAPIDLASKRAAALGVDGRLPLGFDDWFRRCVARDPDDRFPDAERAFDGLRALLARRSRGFAAHARGAMLGASIAGFALAGAYGWSAYRATARAEVARPPTVRRALSITPPAASATAMQREPVAPRAVVPAPIAPTPVSRIAESSVATSNAPIAAARTRGSGTTIESRVHVTPQAPGYLFRAHTDHGAMRCSERGHTRAWEVVRAWAAQITDRLRAREATLATERRMAQRSPTDEITNRVTQDERLLEQERALATTQVERSVVGERARSAALASGSRCLDGGLHVDGTRVFAVWCCP